MWFSVPGVEDYSCLWFVSDSSELWREYFILSQLWYVRILRSVLEYPRKLTPQLQQLVNSSGGTARPELHTSWDTPAFTALSRKAKKSLCKVVTYFWLIRLVYNSNLKMSLWQRVSPLCCLSVFVLVALFFFLITRYKWKDWPWKELSFRTRLWEVPGTDKISMSVMHLCIEALCKKNKIENPARVLLRAGI